MVGSSSASRCLSEIDGLPVLALHSVTCIQQLGLDEILPAISAPFSNAALKTKYVARVLAAPRTQQTTLHDAFVVSIAIW